MIYFTQLIDHGTLVHSVLFAKKIFQIFLNTTRSRLPVLFRGFSWCSLARVHEELVRRR